MKQFLVIGLGRFGTSIAQTLYNGGENVLAIDTDGDLVQEVIDNDIIDNGVCCDATDEKALRDLGINNFDVAFVCIGSNIQASILITLTLKELGVKRVITKAVSAPHGKVLNKIGADKIVYPENFMGIRVAHAEMTPNIIEHLKFSDNFLIVEIKAPLNFINKNLIEIELRKKYRANIIAIRKANGYEDVSPNADSIIEEGDTLIIATDAKTARELERLK